MVAIHRRATLTKLFPHCGTDQTWTEALVRAGRVYSVEAVGRVAQREAITFLLDACQSVGQMPLDVQALGCDYLTGTGRKYLRGPRGSGFLFASRQAFTNLPQQCERTRTCMCAWTWFSNFVPQAAVQPLSKLSSLALLAGRLLAWLLPKPAAPNWARYDRG